ncbi:antitoxin Xre/MbcA/ParS toxin-binding domain-containing protein [Allohahella sp. A8]|uniref:type II RES/Xre toxin-antitoxin system antitoxin n=1 Tax=Allohahella sp. A8 TaxID=3141461 RepID=UPI003A80AF9B
MLEVLGIQSEDHKAMLARVRAGLPSTVVKVLETAYGCSQAAIADCLLIPLSTLRRRLKKAERLNVDESDRVVRLARIKDLTVDMMQGDDEAAIEWLRTPREILGGESPMEHASTEFGGRAVEDLIGRIRHGVFS